MSQSTEVGSKIKAFRQARDISQLELESTAGLAPGMVSRIENGLTNPTKETLLRLADSLELNMAELLYIFGLNSLPPNTQDTNTAITIASSVLDDIRGFAYLLDNRSCIVKISKGFANLMTTLGVKADALIGKHVAEILFDESLGVRKYVDPKNFESSATYILAVLNQERNFLIDTDPWWQELINRLMRMSGFAPLWEKVKTRKIDIYSRDARTIAFLLKGERLTLTYSVTVLERDPRFSLVEYTKAEGLSSSSSSSE